MIVAVGSTNPKKILPVKKIFAKHFEKVTVVGVSVPSGVSEQPLTDDEMYKGAVNRARRALKKTSNAEYGVGIEGGLHKFTYGWFERTMIVVINKKGDIGIGSSGGVVMPEKIMSLIASGKNLEQAIDETFGTTKIGSGIGMFGIFTKGVVTRAKGIEHGVAFALSRFLHEGLF